MATRTAKIGIFLAPLCILVAIGFLTTRFSDRVAGLPPSTEQLLAKWAGAEFTPITDTLKIQSAISQEVNAVSGISAEQKAVLEGSLLSLVEFYRSGLPSDFLAYRAPHGKWDLNDRLRDRLMDKHGIAETEWPNRKGEIFQQWWPEFYGDRWSEFWTAISLEQENLEIEIAQPTGEPLIRYVQQRENAGVGYKEQPLLAIDVSSDSLAATVKLLPKGASPINPVYFRLYWVPEHNVWVPHEIATTYTEQGNQIPQF